MKINHRSYLAGSAIIGLLLAVSACGTEQVADTDPGSQAPVQSREYPPTDVPVWTPGAKPAPTSPDAAERRANALKEQRAHASQLRWERGGHQDGRLKHSGHPSQP
jgi:hypothetical protein